MSKPSRIPDAERTAPMKDLIFRREHGDEKIMSLSSVVLEEVAPGTGWSGVQRWADMLVLGIWKSHGQTLDGYEIKASRADLKKELSDLTKAEALARYCDTWSLVAWDESVLVDGIPESWGIIVTVEGEHGRELKQVKNATKRTPEPWPRSFVCSLVRNAYQQSPGAAYVARAVVEASTRGVADGRSSERSDWRRAMRPLCVALFGANEYRWPVEASDRDALIRIAAERLTQGTLSLEGVA